MNDNDIQPTDTADVTEDTDDTAGHTAARSNQRFARPATEEDDTAGHLSGALGGKKKADS